MNSRYNIRIRYILHEIKVYARTSPWMLALTTLCIINSSILMLFFFGLVHHMEQKKLDGETDDKFIIVRFYDAWQPLADKQKTVDECPVKKGELIDLLLSMDQSVFNDCSVIELSCKYAEDVVEDPNADLLSLSALIDFMIKDGKIIVPPDFESKLKKNNTLKDGRYFTQEEFDQRKRVCIATDDRVGDATLIAAGSAWWDKYTFSNNGIYIIDGNEFECIGHNVSFSSVPLIPATVMRDDVFVMNIVLEYDHAITRHSYETISGELRSRYGDTARIRDLELKQADFNRFNHSIMCIIVIIMILATIILFILYNHMISRRESCLQIYRICGMTAKDIATVLYYEIALINLLSYISGVMIYHFLILLCLKKEFEYLSCSANIYIYTIVGAIFVSVSSLFLKTFLKYKTGYSE